MTTIALPGPARATREAAAAIALAASLRREHSCARVELLAGKVAVTVPTRDHTTTHVVLDTADGRVHYTYAPVPATGRTSRTQDAARVLTDLEEICARTAGPLTGPRALGIWVALTLTLLLAAGMAAITPLLAAVVALIAILGAGGALAPGIARGISDRRFMHADDVAPHLLHH